MKEKTDSLINHFSQQVEDLQLRTDEKRNYSIFLVERKLY